MTHHLVFVLAPQELLPAGTPSWEQLVEAQSQGLSRGFALRIFPCPPGNPVELEHLVEEGRAAAGGHDPYPDRDRVVVCDAVIPHLEPEALWLGVYRKNGSSAEEDSAPLHCLDRFPLAVAENETCWFYPTDNGSYLSWENERSLELMPGYLPEGSNANEPGSYARPGLHVLWSLMADDSTLTCVGLTYRGHRIEWPVVKAFPEASSTWTSFRVDGEAEQPFQRLSKITTTGTVLG